MVKLRYSSGWRLPGGGLKASEEPHLGVLRELREEIGLIAHSEVEHVAKFEELADYRPDTVNLFVVRGVEYRPRWSLEVEAVMQAHLEDLPPNTSARTLRWLDAVRHRI